MSDVRLFQYELEPAVLKNEWKKTQVLTQLSKLNQEHRKLQDQYDQLQKDHNALLSHVQSSFKVFVDPLLHQAYLAALDGTIAAVNHQRELIAAHEEKKKAAMNLVAILELHDQAFHEHRKEQFAEFLSVEENKRLSELDREWSAKSLWQKRMGRQ